ncbi:MAG: amino acid permease [Phycisphaerae bacterium]|nr:amino acid permease [Phycisphaerae bacterium]
MSPIGHALLRRLVGPVTVVCVGIGAAIGSGIFATPGEAAKYIRSPWMILLVWLVAGVVTLIQTLVTAELATRFPKAGGEYQYLKEAYGHFAAFFFGWSFTIFVIGGGGGAIAAALGEFAAELLRLRQAWAAPLLGCGAVIAVTAINALGLRAGAATQNLLTILKTTALLAIGAGVWIVCGRLTPAPPVESSGPAEPISIEAFLLALLPVFWSYTGATDSAKLAEEVKDVRRSLPRALFASAILLTAVYCLYNYALLCALSPSEMAGIRSVPALAFRHVNSLPISDLILVASILICLGAISSMFLANVRVTFALARDGLTFRLLGRMSARQAPVACLVVGGVIACAFVLQRSFEQILRVYFVGSTALFGLTYLSLIVFRLRDRRSGRAFPSTAYKAPAGTLLAAILILLELAIAATILRSDLRTGTYDSLAALALLAVLAILYFVWRKTHLLIPVKLHGSKEPG